MAFINTYVLIYPIGIRGGHIRIIYKAPEDYTKPRQTVCKALTDSTKPRQTVQRLKISYIGRTILDTNLKY